MLMQGLVLMVAGMGTVVVFLSVMVLVMQATGVFFKRYAHVFAAPEPAPRVTQPTMQDGLEAVAVALAAVAARRHG